MYKIGESFIFSPSDLTDFLACEHLTHLERSVALRELERPLRDDPDTELLAQQGDRHEREVLQGLIESELSVVEIRTTGHLVEELKAAEAETLAAMRSGASVIYQATFLNDALAESMWRGHADFLFRVETPSALGPWSYEVADTKLAIRPNARALVQMACYSEQLARLQGTWPTSMIVIGGDGLHHRFPLDEAISYVRFAKQRFVDAVRYDDTNTTYPIPVSHCQVCDWADTCDAKRREDDHLSLVARMRRDTVLKFERAGISTMDKLAHLAPTQTVQGLGTHTLERLTHQARLQVAYKNDGVLRYELLEPAHSRYGLAGLPAPSGGDLFVDFEGDRWVGEYGLEYLFGVIDGSGGDSLTVDNVELAYIAFWAHDSKQEKAAFEAFIDLIIARLDADPAMHVYHYAPYEVQAMKKLMSRYATREAEVDRLLRGEVMVDLYRVVSQGIRVSLESYGLKKLEPFYWPQRDAAISDGAASVSAYERWRETRDDKLLQELQDYNELDCRSTLSLREWLETLRSELEANMGEKLPRFQEEVSPEESSKALEKLEELVDRERKSTELVSRLLAGVPEEPGERSADQQSLWLLAQLVGWHRREAKPNWWKWFERLARSDEELVLDHESIGQLSYEGEVGEVSRSLVHRYSFDPTQEHKLRVGDNPRDPRTEKGAGEIHSLNQHIGYIDLKRAKNSSADHPCSLVPSPPIDDVILRDAVARVGKSVTINGLDAPSPFRALLDVVSKAPPRFHGLEPGSPLARVDESGRVIESGSDAAVRLAHDLDASYLAVQGPPGSGKTYTGARLIVALVQAGHQVGITAHSHKAIDNLLDAVCERAEAEGIDLRAVRKVNKTDLDDPASAPRHPCIELIDKNDAVESLVAEGKVDVVAGTAWLMAREPLAGSLHTLVIDEAGQFSLANLVAVGGAATNLVLLGDPQQLSQPTQAIHPIGAEVSALEHILDGSTTILPERGIFLERSFRMHPEICDFVSCLAYEGRLRANADCARQHIETGSDLPSAGLGWMPVSHEGNRTRSTEEVGAVNELVNRYVGLPFTDQEGNNRCLGVGDIMVIAPYNAQVASLIEDLPDGVRVGTVDRFQGQEAPVVIYSLAASSADEVPRGLDFLFSPNRFNVAISRAQALAIVVGCPTLLRTRCSRPQQLSLVNALCRFVEQAQILTYP